MPPGCTLSYDKKHKYIVLVHPTVIHDTLFCAVMYRRDHYSHGSYTLKLPALLMVASLLCTVDYLSCLDLNFLIYKNNKGIFLIK